MDQGPGDTSGGVSDHGPVLTQRPGGAGGVAEREETAVPKQAMELADGYTLAWRRESKQAAPKPLPLVLSGNQPEGGRAQNPPLDQVRMPLEEGQTWTNICGDKRCFQWGQWGHSCTITQIGVDQQHQGPPRPCW